MYFPYLVARGEESEALISTVCKYSDSNIIPILEPYNDDEDELYSYSKLLKLVESLVANKKTFIILINNEDDLSVLKGKFSDLDDFCIHGYNNSNKNYLTDRQNIAIIHCSQNYLVNDQDNIKYNIFMPEVLRFSTYINKYNSEKTVLVEDGFIRHEPNSDYPAVEDFNSELCFTYKIGGLCGFGDFTILEYGYQPTGGARANDITHVIHLTKKESDTLNKMVVRHFLTTPSSEPDNRDRSAKTIQKAYSAKNEFLKTVGIDWIIEKNPNGTSLGMYKRIGIAHHIELIHSLI